MKIKLTEKQIKMLSYLREQTPDTEENVEGDLLIVKYKNKAPGTWRHFFNNVSGDTRRNKKSKSNNIKS